MATSVWKGALSFGLLTILIRLYPAARAQRAALHQLHRVCHTRLRQPLYCPHCKRIASDSTIPHALLLVFLRFFRTIARPSILRSGDAPK